ncbi:hypothetical protein L2E82_26262 [Cichorium intybus]|uniref:Uncharacterized protein n=1 Tax=Cichorium intybus TaxID=13427 RepID=A0ACB9E5L9_CICIN|nr:hypothetical protein L2E82_26262 [Cichorium intybus]
MLCLSTLGKTLTSTKKLQTPAEVVHKTRSLLLYSKNSLNAASQDFVNHFCGCWKDLRASAISSIRRVDHGRPCHVQVIAQQHKDQ